MGFIGDIISGVGNLISGHSFGHQDYSTAFQSVQPQKIVLPATPAPQAAAPTQDAQGSRPGQKTTTPSFLAAAALPNYGASLPMSSNVGGKSLLGQ